MRNGAGAARLLAILLAGCSGLHGCTGTPTPHSRVTFIGGGGSVTTLDITADSVIDSWNITQSPSLEAVDEPRWDGPPVEDAAYDARRGVVFLVLPDRAREDFDQGKNYRIVAASLPRLERMATFAFPDSARPALLFDPVGDRLIAQTVESDSLPNEKRPGWTVTTMMLASPALTETARMTQHVVNPDHSDMSFAPPFIWSRAAEPSIGASHVSPDGQWIVNEIDLIRLTVDSLTGRRHNVTMSAADKARIATAPDVDTSRVGFIAIDAGARRLLLVAVLWPDSTLRRIAFVALRDVNSAGARHPLFEVPNGVFTLLDDERHVLVQEIDGSPRQSSSVTNFTGRVHLFDGQTGRPLLEIHDARLVGTVSGHTGPICSSPDLSRVYMRTSNSALGVLRTATRDFVVPAGNAMVHTSDLCIFSK